jgi:hypothetical protein
MQFIFSFKRVGNTIQTPVFSAAKYVGRIFSVRTQNKRAFYAAFKKF